MKLLVLPIFSLGRVLLSRLVYLLRSICICYVKLMVCVFSLVVFFSVVNALYEEINKPFQRRSYYLLVALLFIYVYPSVVFVFFFYFCHRNMAVFTFPSSKQRTWHLSNRARAGLRRPRVRYFPRCGLLFLMCCSRVDRLQFQTSSCRVSIRSLEAVVF